MIAKNVAEQFEQREDQQQDQECRQDHPEIDREFPKHVIVEQGGKLNAKESEPTPGAVKRAFPPRNDQVSHCFPDGRLNQPANAFRDASQTVGALPATTEMRRPRKTERLTARPQARGTLCLDEPERHQSKTPNNRQTRERW